TCVQYFYGGGGRGRGPASINVGGRVRRAAAGNSAGGRGVFCRRLRRYAFASAVSTHQMIMLRQSLSKILPSAAVVFAAVFLMCGLFSAAFAMSPEFHMVGEDMHIEDAPDTDVIAFGKKVVVNKRVKGVFVVGGDVVVDGEVTGDVGVIGGSVTQKKDAYIGGDVIVVGGKYQPEVDHPRRGEGKQTVMLGIFEDEIREFTRNPASILTPELSVSFFAQRLLSLLFWFLISMGLTTIAPGAVTRSITRLRLS